MFLGADLLFRLGEDEVLLDGHQLGLESGDDDVDLRGARVEGFDTKAEEFGFTLVGDTQYSNNNGWLTKITNRRNIVDVERQDLESELGQGSTFTLTIPMIHEEVGAMHEMQDRSRTLDPSRAPILVLEDDLQTLFLYESYLRNSGFQILPARNAPDLEEVPADVREHMTFHIVSSVAENVKATSPSAVVMVVSNPLRPDNPLEVVNPAFCEMVGFSAEELLDHRSVTGHDRPEPHGKNGRARADGLGAQGFRAHRRALGAQGGADHCGLPLRRAQHHRRGDPRTGRVRRHVLRGGPVPLGQARRAQGGRWAPRARIGRAGRPGR